MAWFLLLLLIPLVVSLPLAVRALWFWATWRLPAHPCWLALDATNKAIPRVYRRLIARLQRELYPAGYNLQLCAEEAADLGEPVKRYALLFTNPRTGEAASVRLPAQRVGLLRPPVVRNLGLRGEEAGRLLESSLVGEVYDDLRARRCVLDPQTDELRPTLRGAVRMAWGESVGARVEKGVRWVREEVRRGPRRGSERTASEVRSGLHT